MLWTQLIDLLRAAIFATAQVCNGSLGLAVCLVSITLRLALLPLTVRLARRSLAHQRRLLALKPELDRLKEKFASDPAALWRETNALYARRGLTPMDSAGLWSGLTQAPMFMALLAALRDGLGKGVRFLWIGDLARPNLLLTLAVTVLTLGGMAVAPTADPARRMTILPMVVIGAVTFWFLSSTSALFALASGASTLVNVLQAMLVRRGERLDRATSA